MSIKLILIRNGNILGSSERRYIGQATNWPLCERGKQDLVDRKKRGIYPIADVLYTSPLERCTQTARIIYPMLVPTILDSLSDFDYGNFEGRTYEQLKNDPSFQRWKDTAGAVPPPCGENAHEFNQRLSSAFEKISNDASLRSFKTAAVVTHGNCILSLLKQFDIQTKSDIDDLAYQTVNGGGWIVDMGIKPIKITLIKPLF